MLFVLFHSECIGSIDKNNKTVEADNPLIYNYLNYEDAFLYIIS